MKKIIRINGIFYRLKTTDKGQGCTECNKQETRPCGFSDWAEDIIKNEMQVSHICEIRIKNIHHLVTNVNNNLVTYKNKKGYEKTKEFIIIEY